MACKYIAFPAPEEIILNIFTEKWPLVVFLRYFCKRFTGFMNSFFAKTLETWYKSNQRDLPWRNTRDPYKVWISEIILQQTRVMQGLDYFNRFIERFPDVYSLASASEDEVLLYWQGLGYYSRARNLHAASKTIVQNGGFPVTFGEIRRLKGIGDYTAAAIASFAFGLPHAVVDGNVLRVLSRVFGLDTPVDSTQGKKEISQLAHILLDHEHPDIYNQAIMDFGAIQCVPKSPDCSICPLSDKCVAFNENKVDLLPIKVHKAKVRDRFFNYLLVVSQGECLLHQRTGNDIWKGLYEFPLVESDVSLCADELVKHPDFIKINSQLNDPKSLELIKGDVKHVLSHQVIHVNFYLLSSESWSGCEFEEFKKVEMASLKSYPVSRLISCLMEDFQKKLR